MSNQDLKKIMRKEWEEVRKGFYYPQLPQPKLVDNVPNGSIDMKNLEITISEPFIKGFEEHNITPQESLNEVLTHELTHFMKYPGSVLNMVCIVKRALDTFSEGLSSLETNINKAWDSTLSSFVFSNFERMNLSMQEPE